MAVSRPSPNSPAPHPAVGWRSVGGLAGLLSSSRAFFCCLMSWPDPSLRTPHPLRYPQPAHSVPKPRGQSARVPSGRPPIWVVEKPSVELLKHHPNRNISKFSKNGSVIPEMGVLQSPAHHPVALSFVAPPRVTLCSEGLEPNPGPSLDVGALPGRGTNPAPSQAFSPGRVQLQPQTHRRAALGSQLSRESPPRKTVCGCSVPCLVTMDRQ